MRLGVLGGTFDPPHIGHLILAEFARDQLKLDGIVFIPAGDPWRKSDREVAPALHRLAMTRLAIGDNAAFSVDECELNREGPSYTVDTLRYLRTKLGAGDEMWFILGQDALADLPFWHDPAGIAAEARIALVPREGASLPELPFPQDRIDRVEMPYISISSTFIRERSRRGESLRYLVPATVEAYIGQNSLYRPA